MKVLFCTDGSNISYQSVLNFSHWVNDFIVDIICVVDFSFLPEEVSFEDSEFCTQCANSADSILDYSENLLTQNNISVGNKFKMCGSTVDSILDTINSNEYDIVILGSHGKKGIQKWLGSVSQEVASLTNISTYISKNPNHYKKILFALDSTENMTNIVQRSINWLNLEDKEIYLANVYEMPQYLFLEGNMDPNWIIDIQKKQEQTAHILLTQYEKMFKDSNLNIFKKAILSGIPAQEIIKYSSQENVDLVISGTRDKRIFTKFLLGSVSKRVLENVKSDVLIIR